MDDFNENELSRDEARVFAAVSRLYEAIPGYLLSGRHSSDKMCHLVVDVMDALDTIEFKRTGHPIMYSLVPELSERKRAILQLEEKYALSKRESKVLRFLANGRNVAYISEALDISVATAKSHKHAVFTKLGVHSLEELQQLLAECDY